MSTSQNKIPKHGSKSKPDAPVLLSDLTLNRAFENPDSTLTPLGQFIFYSKYSRWREDLLRREYWAETSQRSTEYNVNLAIAFAEENGMNTEMFRIQHQLELEEIFDNQLNTRQALSGRTLWTGGTPASYNNPMSNFNCSFMVLDEWRKLGEIIHLGMVGSGIGFRILKSDIAKLAPIKTSIWSIEHAPYEPVAAEDRQEKSSFYATSSVVEITIGDSKEGWRQSIDILFDFLTGEFANWDNKKSKTVRFNYNHIRAKGERLKQFGGRAGGPDTIKGMFEKFHLIMNGKLDDKYPAVIDGKVQPLHMLDLANAIGKNIVSGDVRSIAEIALLDADDKATMNAKTNIFDKERLNHRFVSNNSVFYETKPSDEQFRWQFDAIKFNGEPCFVNAEVARRRRDDFQGVNPCVEILLADRGLCNLTTVNMMAFAIDGQIDMAGLQRAFYLSARSGFRMTLPKLELPEWDTTQQRDRLIGVSMTGWMDFIDAVNINTKKQNQLLRFLKKTVRDAADEYADQLNINTSLLTTCVKPEGTQSQMFGGVSSGLHVAHAPFFIRRVRAAASDPIAKAAFEFKGWRMSAEFQDGSQHKQITDVLQYMSKLDIATVNGADGMIPKRYRTQHNELSVKVQVRTKGNSLVEVEKEVLTMLEAYYGENNLLTARISNYEKQKGWVTIEWTTKVDSFDRVYNLATKVVIDFPQKSPSKNTKSNFGAIKQLEVYKQFLHNFTEHNPSNTITVRPEEWDAVEEWIKNNWDDMLAVSFLTLYDAPYPLLPFDTSTEEEVNALAEEMDNFDVKILMKYDNGGDMQIVDADCVGGSCPVR